MRRVRDRRARDTLYRTKEKVFVRRSKNHKRESKRIYLLENYSAESYSTVRHDNKDTPLLGS